MSVCPGDGKLASLCCLLREEGAGKGTIVLYVLVPALPKAEVWAGRALSPVPLRVEAAHPTKDLLFFMSLGFS